MSAAEEAAGVNAAIKRIKVAVKWEMSVRIK